jgi:glycine hydroxymethyltransferase
MKINLLENYLRRVESAKRRLDVIGYLAALDHLSSVNPTIATHVLQELRTQRSTLKLIASENYSSLSVQLAMGNLLTDKYSEGYPFHRFYAGCENVDAIEAEATSSACQVFGAHHAYVQPHSGADANLVAFWAILTQRVQHPILDKLGKKNLDDLTAVEFETLRQQLCNQKFLGMDLSSGGHLTHGFRQNVSAKMMRAVTYKVHPATHLLDYSTIATIARAEKPLILLAGYSAYPRRINFAKMREIADEVGAVLMVDMAHFAGLVAGKAFQGEDNPIPYAHIVTSTTHKTLRGPRGGFVLSTAEFAESVDKGCPYVLGGPLPHVIAAKAIGFKEALNDTFCTYAQKIIENARALADGLMKRGIVVVTGGTDNHLVLIDVSKLGITGRIAENALTAAGITVNRNMVPFDPNGAWYTSGIRLGSAALTTLGMGKEEMDEIADLIANILFHTHPLVNGQTGQGGKAKGETDKATLAATHDRIRSLLHNYPLYPDLIID